VGVRTSAFRRSLIILVQFISRGFHAESRHFIYIMLISGNKGYPSEGMAMFGLHSV
jgi:hypothetical protein